MAFLEWFLDNLVPIIIVCIFLYYLPTAIRYYKRWKKELDQARQGGNEAIDAVIIRATGDVLSGNAMAKQEKT